VCGIAGIVGDEAESESLSLGAMGEALRHRGPNDGGEWRGSRACFAHRRLSILDTSDAGHQPWVSEDERHVLVFNGEIYNFRDLRQQLEGLGHAFHSQCDTEVLLAALRQWGDAAVERLNGMFAFAFYDTLEERLLLARDRLGIKPIFYAQQGDGLLFASELNALLASGMERPPISAAALDAYFTYLYVPEPETIFEGVHKLLPGHTLVFHRGRVTTERYWQPRYEINNDWTLDSAAEAYKELLEDAVRLRLVSDVPLGAFLSGGLDSSSVVGMVSRLADAPVKTFCIGFDDAHANELGYARMAAEHFGTDHSETMLHPDMVDLLPQLVRHFGEPFADSSALPTWLVSQVARESVTVALSGDGGDELFAGYTWAHMNWRVARYRRFPAPLRRAADILLHQLPASPTLDKFRHFSRDSFLDNQASFRRRNTALESDARMNLYASDLRDAVTQTATDTIAQAEAAMSPEDWMLYDDTTRYLPGDILTKVDRMSMAHGLEARVPLLDHRLVEFAATVPFHLKFDGTTSKRLAKHAVQDMLPPGLLTQRKRGFALPIQKWFRQALGQHFQDALLSGDSHAQTYLNPQALQRLHQEHQSSQHHHGHTLWSLLIFEHWLREMG
jgi:asparagine synthase (glutamine-hydrolysing)